MSETIVLTILAILLLAACVVLVAKLLQAKGKLSLFEKLEGEKLAAESQLEVARRQLGEAETTIARLQERADEKELTSQAERVRSDADREKFSHEKTDLANLLEAERAKSANLAVEMASLKSSLEAALTKTSEQAQVINDQKQQIADKAATIENERQKSSSLAVELATLQSERDAAQDQLRRYQLEEKMRSDLVRTEIEHLSNKIFEEKSGKFKEIGTTAIADLVTPVREHLEKLQKALAESETKDAVRENSLREELARVGLINAQLGSQAESLAKALRSDNKLIGDFGEEILERILEFSGLQKGPHFVEQGADLSLVSEDGRRLKPDIVIFLPENRCLVVDSKMSLKSWADAQTNDEIARAAALNAFKGSVRTHVNGLASKPYTESLSTTGKVVVDFKFLFIPIEGAFHAAIDQDRNLYQYAFEKKVILVSPTTLLAVLSTVNHTWKQFEIGKNAEAIRDRAGLLLDKLIDFVGSVEKIGDQLEKVRGVYDEARGRLSEGRGNLVGQAKKLKALGVKSDKSLPRSLEALPSDEEEE